MAKLSDQGASTGAHTTAGDGEQRPAHLVDEPVSPRADAYESILLSFGRALGGTPAAITDLPFTEQAEECSAIRQQYVTHDEQVLDIQTTVTGGDHVGLCSEPGTGKTMLRRYLAASIRDSDDVVAAIDCPAAATPRQCCERVLRAAEAAGYGIDPADYWQVDGGVPWRTTEMEQALDDVTARARADGTQILLVVDECETVTPSLRRQLETLADRGIRLLLVGRPSCAPVIETFADAVADPVARYSGLDPFDVGDVAAYAARSLAVFRDVTPDEGGQDLFSGEVLHTLCRETRGNPRAVRQTCFELFVRGALVWNELDHAAEAVTITPDIVSCDAETLEEASE